MMSHWFAAPLQVTKQPSRCWWRSTKNRFTAIAWRTTKDFHVAEDIVQETFLKVHQKLATLKDPQRFSGWLNAIARRRCLAWFREKRLNVQISENVSNTMRRNDPYSGYLVEEQAKETSQELREIVKKWLAKLPENERTVITLHYFDGMLCEDIAAFLGVTTNTIKSRLNRARNRLKKNESLIQSTLDDFQFFAMLSETIKTERKIRVCINATTENGGQFREGRCFSNKNRWIFETFQLWLARMR